MLKTQYTKKPGCQVNHFANFFCEWLWLQCGNMNTVCQTTVFGSQYITLSGKLCDKEPRNMALDMLKGEYSCQ